MYVAAAYNRRLSVAGGMVITASGQTGPLVLASNAVPTLNLHATITAVSGTTPSITFGLAFATDPAEETWPVGSFGAATTGAAQTAPGTDVLVASVVRPLVSRGGTRYYRITWTVTGTTPSFTLGALYTDN